jgi:hypothetical protein
MQELFAVSGRVIEELWVFLERHVETAFETLGEIAHASKLCGGPHHDLKECQDMIERWAPWSVVVLVVVVVGVYVSKLSSK